MKSVPAFYKNEDGSIIVMVLMILIIITIVGVSAIKQSTTELKLTRNEGCAEQAFYHMDSIAHDVFPVIDDLREGVQPVAASYPNITLNGTFWTKAYIKINSITNIDALANDAESKVVPGFIDVNRVRYNIAGESRINRAGYDGLGKSIAGNWVAKYRVTPTGTAGIDAGAAIAECRSISESDIDAVR